MLTQTIGEIRFQGSSYIAAGELADFIYCQPGQPFSYARLSQDVRKLFSLGVYEDIQVRYRAGESLGIDFILFEKKLLHKVLWPDFNLPADKDALLAKAGLVAGRLVGIRELPEMVEELEELLAEEGYSAVDLAYKTNSYENNVIVIFSLKHAEYDRLKAIQLQGGTRNLDEQVAEIEADFQGKILSPLRMDEIRDRLFRLLRDKGYREATIDSFAKQSAGVLSVAVTLNDRYAVDFTGNKRFPRAKLIEEVPQLLDFTNVPEEADAIAANIREVYQAHGFFGAQVAARVEQIKPRYYLLSLDIQEGPAYHVRRVYIKGNHTIADKELLRYLKLRPSALWSYPAFRQALLAEDTDTLTAIYQRHGYLDVAVTSRLRFIEDLHQVLVVYHVTEGLPYHVQNLRIAGEMSAQEQSALLQSLALPAHTPFYQGLLDTIRDRTYAFLFARGYLNSEVNVEADGPSEHGYALTATVYKGPCYYIRRIIYTGNRNVPYWLLKRWYFLEKQIVYDPSRLVEIKKVLYDTGYFNTVTIQEFEDYVAMEERDLIVALDETRRGSAFVSGGYDSQEKFRLQLEFNYHNISGVGADISAGFKLSDLEQRYTVRLINKYLLKDTDIIFSLFKENLYRDIRDEDISGGSMLATRRYDDLHLTWSFGYEYKDIVSQEASYRNSVVGDIFTTLIYDTRNEVLNPRQGAFMSLTMKHADTDFLSSDNFSRAYAKAVYYLTLGRATFVTSLQAGANFVFDPWSLEFDDSEFYPYSDYIPFSERFLLGGRLTLRGYGRDEVGPIYKDDKPFGGNAMFCFNTEVRIDLGYNLGLALFFEAGNTWYALDRFSLKDLKEDFGTGLYYLTPIGPIRLDVGWKVSPASGESRYEYYLSFGHPF